jgi:cobalamin biosynthesis Mg chelatase CobN
MSEQRYRRDDRGIDRQDVSLMLIVVVLALVLAVAALWIGLR